MNAERAERFKVTKKGIIIGSAYTPPPALPGSHAEAIQAALLTTPRRPMRHEAAMAAAARLFIAAVDAWHDSTFLALYRWHRRQRFGPITSLRLSVQCLL